MTKPHEKTWRVAQTPQGYWVREPSDRGPAFEPSVCMVYAVSLERLPGEPGTKYFQRTEAETGRIAALIAAAPDMARALLLWLPDNGHTQECGNTTASDGPCSLECGTTRAALRKAGVLP